MFLKGNVQLFKITVQSKGDWATSKLYLRKGGSMAKKTRLMTVLLVCILVSFYHQGKHSTAYGDEVYQKTKLDPRDVYLKVEALCGYEGLPYEFLIPKDDYVKTKLDPNDIYVDLEDFCGEGIPYKYLVVPGKYIKTKIDYKEELKSGPEEMMSEDPTSLDVKSKK